MLETSAHPQHLNLPNLEQAPYSRKVSQFSSNLDKGAEENHNSNVNLYRKADSPSNFHSLNNLDMFFNEKNYKNDMDDMTVKPFSGNEVYSSMYDIKKLRNEASKIEHVNKEILNSQPMSQSKSYNYAEIARQNAQPLENIYKLRPAKEQPYHHYKKPKLSINSTTTNGFLRGHNNHYDKISEITLMNKPFSDIIFKKPDTFIHQSTVANDSLLNANPPAEENDVSSKFIYDSAKKHGFGLNVKEDVPEVGNTVDDLFPLSMYYSVLTKDESVYDDSFQNSSSELKLKDPFLTHSNISEDKKTEWKNTSTNDSSSKSISNLISKNVSKVKNKSFESDEILSTEVLLNPIKEILIKQLTIEIDAGIQEADIGNEDNENNSFKKIETVINDFYITKHISNMLKQLNTNTVLLNKQTKELKYLDLWKKESINKTVQLQKSVNQLYEDQVSQNLKQLMSNKKEIENRFKHSMEKNEILTVQHAKIVENFNQLKEIKLTKLEKWAESIHKMEKYQHERSCRFLSYYDFIFILAVSVIYYFWHHQK